MSTQFDPYHLWLGISPKDQPPTHYRLLGIDLFESDANVIANAADQRMAHIRSFQTGKNSVLSQKILNEISAARVCLLNAAKKQAYDNQLRRKAQASPPPIVPPETVPARESMPEVFDFAPPNPMRQRIAKRKKSSQAQMVMGTIFVGVLALVGIVVVSMSRSERIPELKREVATRSLDALKPASRPMPKPQPVRRTSKSRPAVEPETIILPEPKPEFEKPPLEPRQKSGAEVLPYVAPREKKIAKPKIIYDVVEYVWQTGQPGIKMITAKEGLCFLTGLSGRFLSGGEWVKVIPERDGYWHLTAGARQPLWAKSLAIRFPSRVKGRFDEFIWKHGDRPIRMIAKDQGFCFLSSVSGGFIGGGEAARILPGSDGYWNLTCNCCTPIGARAVAIRVNSSLSFPRETINYRWETGAAPVKMLHKDDGFCFLTGIGGGFHGLGEKVEIRLAEDGFWYLEGRAAQGIFAEAMGVCFSVEELREEIADFHTTPPSIDLHESPLIAIPDDAARQKSLAIIHGIFKDDYREKAALAGKLFQRAKETRNATDRFVLLREAIDAAAETWQGELAFEIIDALAAEFDICSHEMKAEVLAQAAKRPRILPNQKTAIAQAALRIIDDAVAEDNFEVAKKLGRLAGQMVALSKDREFARDVLAKNRELDAMAKAYADAENAMAVLKNKPDDPDANLTVGKYLCFTKGDWEQGLPRLAKGNDPALKALAEKDVAGAESAAKQVKLGDAWWDVSKGRAAYWYEKALPQLTGLERDRLERRVSRVETKVAVHSLKTGAA